MARSTDDLPVGLSAVPGVSGADLSALRDETGRWLRLALPDAKPAQSLVVGEPLIAIIDSGVEIEHPTIAAALAEPALDVVGEGPDDCNGHGTYVALALLAWAPAAQLLSIKAVDKSGVGTRLQLLQALQVALEHGADILNLSVGSYNPNCAGDCVLCNAVGNLAAAGVIVLAAAGNVPGQTDCPAKAGMFNETAISVAAMNPATGKTAWYSGVGELLVSPGEFALVPV